ncbi:hypothetical protein AL073_07180 [Loktanella sp. 1ANDIMAR09]|uniref:Uncharacterized protein n=1 Tax=Yoonia rosea TaxID=287098 RepID=A0A1R3X327_9RHOB|nr:hypothetical protein [Yoonia rosea]KQB96873.1 hypothetical protein AL073_07180 [Loktanella sp. 1ANDIMAR09]SIT85331.1 hypothetical protein SAMN05421665_2034 [Yoonia rosea]
MGRDWIIDVLADLRSFARDNDLPMLRAQLEEAELVAQVEIASRALPDARHQSGDRDRMLGLTVKSGPVRRT